MTPTSEVLHDPSLSGTYQPTVLENCVSLRPMNHQEVSGQRSIKWSVQTSKTVRDIAKITTFHLIKQQPKTGSVGIISNVAQNKKRFLLDALPVAKQPSHNKFEFTSAAWMTSGKL